MTNNIILGDGLLGTEIQKQTNWDYTSRKKDSFDFCVLDSYVYYIYKYDTIINCIACTDTYSSNRDIHWKTNFLAVIDLVDYCNRMNKKLVHISTDYVYGGSVLKARETDVPVNAPNWYSYTKMLGDACVQGLSKNYLLIRTSFKPKPFPYKEAIVTQVGNFDYVDVIADYIVQLINKNASGIYNVGTKIKTIYKLATQTCPECIPSYVTLHETMPRNITMDVSKMKDFLNEN